MKLLRFWKSASFISNECKFLVSKTTFINILISSGYGGPVSPHQVGPVPQVAQGPGPQVPPRVGDGQERVLSVSGKKKCSACKDELGM